jgi:uncharacterized membrane protein YedE/YeeE
MKTYLNRSKAAVLGIVEKTKVRKGMLSFIAVFFILQLYFVRELLAAELLFGLGFAVLAILAAICYLIGVVGERGLDLAEAGIRVLSSSARRGYSSLEYLSRRPFRHPRSESAQ